MPADTNDKYDEATQTIADFIGDLGKAIAQRQKELDKNTALIAEEL